jgi:uncharacterized membrane protein
MRRTLILLCLLVLSVLARADNIYDAATLAKGAPTAALVEDAAAGHAVLELADAKFDFGFKPDVQPGLYRFTLRLKTTTRATGAIHLFGTSGNWNQSPYALRQELPDVTGEELPDVDAWVDVTRVLRFTGPGYWGGVIGGWKGLRLDRFSVTRITEPVLLLQARPTKLLYRVNEPASLDITLVNTTDAPQTVRLLARVENGLADFAQGVPQEITLPAVTEKQRLEQKDSQAVLLPLPALAEYGNAVSVQVQQGGKTLGAATDYCYVTNIPLQVGHYYGWSFPGDYTCSTTPAHFETMRRTYFPIAECFFWAPCDNSMQVPTTERWWSGQTLLPLAKKPLQDTIARGHEQGFSFVSYATRWGFGWRMWEFARQHPDLVEWEMPNGNFQLSYHVAHMEIEERERDEERKDLGSTGILTAAWGNPDAVAYHVKQLQESMKVMGWDGFRYDNGSPVIDVVPDVFGRTLPLPGWDHAKCIAALRAGPRQVKPGAIYGNNTGWNLDPDSQPADDDPFTQQARDNGMIMQEGETNGGFGAKPFVEEAHRYALAGYNAIRFGGHQYNIINPYLTGSDHLFQVILTLAGACHLCYRVRDEAQPLMQLACRHSDLLYGSGLHFVLKPDGICAVDAPARVLWKDYVRYRRLSPTRRLYLVHLINLPPGEKLGETKGQFSAPVPNVATRWTLPAGWKATKAYGITADGGYHMAPLTLQGAGNTPAVTLPRLQRWSIVVLDATGPALPDAPTPTITTTATSASKNLSTPEAIALFEKAPADAITPTVRYLPNVKSDKPFVLPLSGYKVPGATVVDDPAALNGKALRLGPEGVRNNIGYPPGVDAPGHYRLTLRVKATTPPPANGVLSGFVSSANNNATPGAAGLRTDFRFIAADCPVGQWVDLSVNTDFSFRNFWGGFDGGWDGLLLDRATITYVGPFTRNEFAKTITTTWRDNLFVAKNNPPRVWYGAGLYYRLYHLREALQLVGTETDFTTAWRFRGPTGFEQPFPATPEALAAYDIIILADIEARALLPQQQVWLDTYVQRGGCLLVLGGPMSLGNGGWADALYLADLLPVTLHRYDLTFSGKTAPVPLQPAGPLARSLDFTAKPVALWLHDVQPKPGAVVELTAGGKPALVVGRYGKGRVAVVAIAPLGVAPKGATPFWEWKAWQELMAATIQWLL